MQAGRLNRRIKIMAPVETQSESGEIITTWALLATVWAEQKPLNGYERYAASQVVGRTLNTFRMRYSSATKQITSKHRIICDNREFDVTDVREPKLREMVELDCFSTSTQPLSGVFTIGESAIGGPDIIP